MSKKSRIAFVFSSTFYAMSAEDILSQKGLHPQFMALPSDLGLGCGTAVTVKENQESMAKSLLKKEGIPVFSLWEVVDGDPIWKKR